MGIHGIYKEIGPGRRIALSKFCVDHYVRHSRPLRLAVDISIWLFQIQAGKGGSNPALRTFYYRLLRLLTLNIHPLFVFDGPNKPPFKRNKRVGGPHVKVSSIPEFLAKQLLKQFAFPIHLAPGEAEAECALLQNKGIVDAVLTEDVDALMFGTTLTMRHWTPEQKSSKVPTHVNIYSAHTVRTATRLDNHGMILVALMSGGDYIPEGIPGCGPKTALEAAKAGFGADLVAIDPDSHRAAEAYADWRQRLRHELQTNESKYFKQKRKALVIPDDFPDPQVLRYYTNPCVSSPENLSRLTASLIWDKPLDLPSLRTFTAEAFDWNYLDGANKFVRNLAPALLVRQLRLRAEQGCHDDDQPLAAKTATEARIVIDIHGKRNHPTTDNSDELRISFLPTAIVDIDLTVEEVGPEVELPLDTPSLDVDDEDSAKTRGPSLYDPTVPDKVWIMDVFLRLGVPLMVQDWEASQRLSRIALAARQANKRPTSSQPSARPIDSFMKVVKPVAVQPSIKSVDAAIDEVDLSVDCVPTPARLPIVEEIDLSRTCSPKSKSRPAKRRSDEAKSPTGKHQPNPVTPKAKRFAQQTIIDLLTPSPRRQIDDPAVEIDLPDSVTIRRHKSPFRRHHTAPEDGMLPATSVQPRATAQAHAGYIEAIDLATPEQPMIETQGRISDSLPVTNRLCEPNGAKSTKPAANNHVPQKSATKKHIMIRQSLEGAWKEVDSPDLTASKRVQVIHRRMWRRSEVEVMDLTA